MVHAWATKRTKNHRLHRKLTSLSTVLRNATLAEWHRFDEDVGITSIASSSDALSFAPSSGNSPNRWEPVVGVPDDRPTDVDALAESDAAAVGGGDRLEAARFFLAFFRLLEDGVPEVSCCPCCVNSSEAGINDSFERLSFSIETSSIRFPVLNLVNGIRFTGIVLLPCWPPLLAAVRPNCLSQ